MLKVVGPRHRAEVHREEVRLHQRVLRRLAVGSDRDHRVVAPTVDLLRHHHHTLLHHIQHLLTNPLPHHHHLTVGI